MGHLGLKSSRFFALAMFVASFCPQDSQARNNYYDTTGGKKRGGQGRPDTNKDNGFTDADVAAMDAEQKDILMKLRRGRLSSLEDPGSDWSVDLDIHDSNFDGITDHDGAANGLEGPMDQVALGSKGMRGKAREDALKKATEALDKSSGCDAKLKAWAKASHPAGSMPPNCQSPSPILVNRGAAHSGEVHSVYEMTKDAVSASEKAGQAANAKVQEKALSQAGRGSQKGVNIDLLRDQKAFIDTVQDKVIKDAARYFTAKRLAGDEATTLANNGGKADTEIGNMIGDGASDEEVANRLAERNQLQSQSICNVDSVPKVCTPQEEQQCQWGANPAAGKKCDSLKNVAGSGLTSSEVDKLYADALKMQSAQTKKDIKEDAQKIVSNDCINGWCYDYEHADRMNAKAPASTGAKKKPNEAYQKVSGSVLGAYDNTLEVIYKGLNNARQGAINSWEQNFGEGRADFNASTDAKTTSKPYAAMMEQVKENQQVAADLAAYEKRKVQIMTGQVEDYGARNPFGGEAVGSRSFAGGYSDYSSNQFQASGGFDPNAQNNPKLFGLNAAKDGVMTAKPAMDVGMPINSSQSPADAYGGAGSVAAAP